MSKKEIKDSIDQYSAHMQREAGKKQKQRDGWEQNRQKEEKKANQIEAKKQAKLVEARKFFGDLMAELEEEGFKTHLIERQNYLPTSFRDSVLWLLTLGNLSKLEEGTLLEWSIQRPTGGYLYLLAAYRPPYVLSKRGSTALGAQAHSFSEARKKIMKWVRSGSPGKGFR